MPSGRSSSGAPASVPQCLLPLGPAHVTRCACLKHVQAAAQHAAFASTSACLPMPNPRTPARHIRACLLHLAPLRPACSRVTWMQLGPHADRRPCVMAEARHAAKPAGRHPWALLLAQRQASAPRTVVLCWWCTFDRVALGTVVLLGQCGLGPAGTVWAPAAAGPVRTLSLDACSGAGLPTMLLKPMGFVRHAPAMPVQGASAA